MHIPRAPRLLPPTRNPSLLPIPHHLLYFEPTKPQRDLLPDGTNPDQSPGDPFVRRMWAGGSVLYNHASPLYMDNRRGVCAEYIRSVSVKGKSGSEKVFVGIERRLAYLSESEHSALANTDPSDESAIEKVEQAVRKRLWRDDSADFGDASVVETRNIVFLSARSESELATAKEALARGEKVPTKMLKPSHAASFFDTTVTPNEKLLFRFSALTFNAHAIHLDPAYCREVEGHRDLLFHGPMTFTFMVVLLQKAIADAGARERIAFVEYRNLAPLYCHEPIRFCGHKTAEGRYEVWAETPEGGVAVKGNVRTEKY